MSAEEKQLQAVWGARADWSDSKSLFDTDMAEMARFERDWARCLAIGVSKLILKSDDDADADEDGDGLSDEVQEVKNVLWDFRALVTATATRTIASFALHPGAYSGRSRPGASL